MKEKETKGLGVAGAVFIVFLVLKLTDNIDWSWLWVTAPLWIPASAIFVIALFTIVFASIGTVMSRRR